MVWNAKVHTNACHFLASFVTKEKASGNFTVLHVLPTTEAGFRDNPAYKSVSDSESISVYVPTEIFSSVYSRHLLVV